MSTAETNTDITFNKNEDTMKQLISAMEKRFEKVALGGGKARIEKQHEQGKLSARERVEYLLDKDQPQIEIGAFAGDGMYEEHGGCPSGGVIVMKLGPTRPINENEPQHKMAVGAACISQSTLRA